MKDLLTDIGRVEQTRRRIRLLRCNIVRFNRDKPKNFCSTLSKATGLVQEPLTRHPRRHLPKLGDAHLTPLCQTSLMLGENDNVTADFSFEDGGYLIEVYASEVLPGQWKVHSVFQRLSDLDDEQGIATAIRHESDVIFESMPHAMLAGREQAKQLVRQGSVGL